MKGLIVIELAAFEQNFCQIAGPLVQVTLLLASV
jgi:hypothetical protein